MCIRDSPRGANIQAGAGHCSVGPFGSTGSTGVYSTLCSRLTSEEKCLAYLKQHVRDDGKLREALDSAKAKFCLTIISSTLF